MISEETIMVLLADIENERVERVKVTYELLRNLAELRTDINI